jgi:hypothetical protein
LHPAHFFTHQLVGMQITFPVFGSVSVTSCLPFGRSPVQQLVSMKKAALAVHQSMVVQMQLNKITCTHNFHAHTAESCAHTKKLHADLTVVSKVLIMQYCNCIEKLINETSTRLSAPQAYPRQIHLPSRDTLFPTHWHMSMVYGKASWP